MLDSGILFQCSPWLESARQHSTSKLPSMTTTRAWRGRTSLNWLPTKKSLLYVCSFFLFSLCVVNNDANETAEEGISSLPLSSYPRPFWGIQSSTWLFREIWRETHSWFENTSYPQEAQRHQYSSPPLLLFLAPVTQFKDGKLAPPPGLAAPSSRSRHVRRQKPADSAQKA